MKVNFTAMAKIISSIAQRISLVLYRAHAEDPSFNKARQHPGRALRVAKL